MGMQEEKVIFLYFSWFEFVLSVYMQYDSAIT